MRRERRAILNYSKWLRWCLQVICTGLPVALPAQNVVNIGARFVLTGPVQLVFHNTGLKNSGPWITTPDASVWFTGEQPVDLYGYGNLTFSNVVISKPQDGTVQLNQGMDISGKIRMVRGHVLLNNNILNLGSTGSIEGESGQSMISGKSGGSVLTRKKVITPMNAFNPGNIGVALTSSDLPGILTVERKHVQEAVNAGQVSIRRSFTISATNNPPLNATLRFYYLDEELAGLDETGLAMWTRSGVTGPWTLLGSEAADANANWVEKDRVTSWGSFTLYSSGASIQKMQRMLNPTLRAVENVNEQLKVQVTPNPTTDRLNLVFNGTQERDAAIHLYDQSGRLLEQKKIHVKAGMNSVQLSLVHYPAGIYFISDNTGRINVKIIKQ